MLKLQISKNNPFALNNSLLQSKYTPYPLFVLAVLCCAITYIPSYKLQTSHPDVGSDYRIHAAGGLKEYPEEYKQARANCKEFLWPDLIAPGSPNPNPNNPPNLRLLKYTNIPISE